MEQLGSQKLFFATSNPGKLVELSELVAKFFPFFKNTEGRAPKMAVENSKTFLGNSLIKAEELAKELIDEGMESFCIISDDSGLEVEPLKGAPGVLSARYAGEDATSADNIAKLKKDLEKFPRLDDREARYVCALTLLICLNGTQKVYQSEGFFEGYIGFEEKGESGFGYDPLFLLLDKTTSVAQIGIKEKSELSHRFEAFEEMRDQLIGPEEDA